MSFPQTNNCSFLNYFIVINSEIENAALIEIVKENHDKWEIICKDFEPKQQIIQGNKVARDRLITSFIVPCGGSKREERREKSATGKNKPRIKRSRATLVINYKLMISD